MSKSIKIIIGVIVVILISVLTDFFCVKLFNTVPIFSIKETQGNNKIYKALFYKVLKCNVNDVDSKILIGSYFSKLSCDDKTKYDEASLVCEINNNNLFTCDNIINQIYNDKGDLTYIKVNDSGYIYDYYYSYTYNDIGLVDSIVYQNSIANITYNSNKTVQSIKYNVDKNSPVYLYKFEYNADNTIKEIKVFYDHVLTSSVNYEYYMENGLEYVKETSQEINSLAGYIRIFKKQNMVIPTTAFEIINYLPSIYYINNMYLPTNNYINVNNVNLITYLPSFVTQTIKYTKINFDGSKKETEYYFDKTGRYLTNSSDNSEINMMEDINSEELLRHTIYVKKIGDDTNNYNKFYYYKTKYYYKSGKIYKYIKYKEKEISKKEYDSLHKKYSKYIENTHN
jgi:hypothetical protein